MDPKTVDRKVVPSDPYAPTTTEYAVLEALWKESRYVHGAPDTSGTYVSPELIASRARVGVSLTRTILRRFVEGKMARRNGPRARGPKFRITLLGLNWIAVYR